MNKRSLLITSIISISVFALGASLAVKGLMNNNFTLATGYDSNNYWNHYAEVEPTRSRHGSKEFWANCSTHDFVLEQPEVSETIREGVAFDTTPYFDELDPSDPRYIEPLEKIDIKGYFTALLDALELDPYSYIPDTMRPEEVTKVTAASVNYDFTNFTNVSDIKYGGFGEQWHMVIENVKQSQLFYNITNYGSEIITTSRTLIANFLDSYYSDTIDKTFNEDARYISKINFDGLDITYNIKFVSGISIPVIGTVTPQLDMEYEVTSNIKTVRIQFNENNALKFVVTPESYTFGLEYGVEAVSRKAYFTIERFTEGNVEGHIYEYVQYKGEDKINSCADFYIDETYTSVIGNKVSGMAGFAGFINELYETANGKLIGYKVKEVLTKWGFTATYHTLWFNLNNITGITNVKAIPNENIGIYGDNNHDIYLNNSASIFEPTKNKKAFISTSRKYDVELRKQFFYGIEAEQVVEYKTSIPMMFIQDDHDEYTNYSDFSADILKDCGITAYVNLASKYLTKIRADYETFIPIFEVNKDDIDGDAIDTFIGDADVF